MNIPTNKIKRGFFPVFLEFSGMSVASLEFSVAFSASGFLAISSFLQELSFFFFLSAENVQ